MRQAHRLAVPGAALALLISATAYADSQQGNHGAAWSLPNAKSFHNLGKQSCERKRLQAAQNYRKCFHEIESAVLTGGLILQEQEERIERCAGRLTQELKRASRRAGEDGCAVPVDLDDLRDRLDNAQRETFQLVTGSSDMACTLHDNYTTTRCVFATSQYLDLDTLMTQIGLSTSDPSDVVITMELYGGKARTATRRGRTTMVVRLARVATPVRPGPGSSIRRSREIWVS